MLESIYKVFVPSGLILLMFGMGMQLVPEDWKRVARYPRAVLAGLLGQFLLLPAVAFLLIYSLSLPLAVAAGILILAVCPGGVVSNTVSFLARADIPLSVTLTAISSILALLTVPLILHFGLDLIQSTGDTVVETGRVELPVGGTIKQLLILVFLPLIAGMLVRRYAANFALRSDRWMRVAGVLVLVVLLVGSVAMEFDFFMENLNRLWPVLLVLNLATLLGGYALALAFGMDGVRRRTVAIEVGIQNVALGVMVALNILKQPEWAVVPSVYSLVMMSTAFILIFIGSRWGRDVNPSQPWRKTEMAGYLIVTIHGVSDLEKLQTYRKAAGPSVQAFGGRPVVTSRSTQQIVEGDETAGVVMFKFPSYDQAVNWYNSSEYQEVKEIRMGAADVHMTIAEGMD